MTVVFSHPLYNNKSSQISKEKDCFHDCWLQTAKHTVCCYSYLFKVD